MPVIAISKPPQYNKISETSALTEYRRRKETEVMSSCSAARIQKNIEELACFSQTPGSGCTRPSYTEEFRLAADYIIEEMRSAGLSVRVDAAGSLIGRFGDPLAEGPVLLTGSHFDSVPHGGNFDGPAGIFAALEAVRVLKEMNFHPEIPIEVIAMPEEEGARFGGGLFASRAICGTVTKEELERTVDSSGISQYEAMRTYGLNPEQIASARRDPAEIAAFLELHIEQGPVLEQTQTQIGIVDSIVGLQCFQITVCGRADHAGTTPLTMRADALLAAARAMAAATDTALSLEDGTVITFNSIHSSPAASNIVSSRVSFTADCRSSRTSSIKTVLHAFENSLKASARKAAGLFWEITPTLDAAPAIMHPKLLQLLEDSARSLSLSCMHLSSGAGHDAMNFADVCPTAMIFVPSRGGRSHCPEEWTDYAQLACGAEVLVHTLAKLSGKNRISLTQP